MNGFVPLTCDTSHLNAAHDVARIAGHDRRLFAAVTNKTPEWTTRKQARDNAFVRLSFFFSCTIITHRVDVYCSDTSDYR